MLRDLGYDIQNIALAGGAGNDQIRVGTGHYAVDGGAGTNTLLVAGNASDYSVADTATGAKITDRAASATEFDLTNIERAKFADMSVALDAGINQSGGEAALLLGAVLPGQLAFDPSKRAVVGAVIALFDQGYTMPVLSGAVLRLPIWDTLANGSDDSHIAEYLLKNVDGQAPDQTTLGAAASALDAEMVQSVHGDANWLANLALGAANQAHVGLVGLASTGIAYA